MNGKITSEGLELARNCASTLERTAADWTVTSARELLSEGLSRSLQIYRGPLPLPQGHPGKILSEIELASTRHGKTFSDLLADQNRLVSRNNELWQNKEFNIPQRGFATRQLHEPIATDGLQTCVGLLVVDKSQRLHYVAHLDGSAEVSSIQRSLSRFDLSKTQNYMMLGPYQSNVPIHTFSALADNPAAVDKLRFIKWDGDGNGPNFVSYEGKLYRYFGGYSLGMML
jgi:hypothetical protein